MGAFEVEAEGVGGDGFVGGFALVGVGVVLLFGIGRGV